MLKVTGRDPRELDTISSLKYWLIIYAFRLRCFFSDPGDWSPWDTSKPGF